MIKIDKDIPIKSRRRRRNFTSKYPFESMEIGDSFFISGDYHKTYGCVYMAMRKFKNFKFVIRGVDGGVRCWRIA